MELVAEYDLENKKRLYPKTLEKFGKQIFREMNDPTIMTNKFDTDNYDYQLTLNKIDNTEQHGVIDIINSGSNVSQTEYKNRMNLFTKKLLGEKQPYMAVLNIENDDKSYNKLLLVGDNSKNQIHVADFHDRLKMTKDKKKVGIIKVKKMNRLQKDLSNGSKKFSFIRYLIKEEGQKELKKITKTQNKQIPVVKNEPKVEEEEDIFDDILVEDEVKKPEVKPKKNTSKKNIKTKRSYNKKK